MPKNPRSVSPKQVTITSNSNNSLVATSITDSQLTLHYAAFVTIVVRATDRAGLYVETNFTLEGTNTGPVLDLTGNRNANEGQLLTFTATAIESDADQAMTFTLDSGAPSGANITTGGGLIRLFFEQINGRGVDQRAKLMCALGLPALSPKTAESFSLEG